MVVNTFTVDDEISRHFGVILPLHTKTAISDEPNEMGRFCRTGWKVDKILFNNGPALHLRKWKGMRVISSWSWRYKWWFFVIFWKSCHRERVNHRRTKYYRNRPKDRFWRRNSDLRRFSKLDLWLLTIIEQNRKIAVIVLKIDFDAETVIWDLFQNSSYGC